MNLILVLAFHYKYFFVFVDQFAIAIVRWSWTHKPSRSGWLKLCFDKQGSVQTHPTKEKVSSSKVYLLQLKQHKVPRTPYCDEFKPRFWLQTSIQSPWGSMLLWAYSVGSIGRFTSFKSTLNSSTLLYFYST